MFGILKQNFPVNTRVRMGRTIDGVLDGHLGTIMGRATNPDACDFYIVELDNPRPTGERAIVLIESCLEPV